VIDLKIRRETVTGDGLPTHNLAVVRRETGRAGARVTHSLQQPTTMCQPGLGTGVPQPRPLAARGAAGSRRLPVWDEIDDVHHQVNILFIAGSALHPFQHDFQCLEFERVCIWSSGISFRRIRTFVQGLWFGLPFVPSPSLFHLLSGRPGAKLCFYGSLHRKYGIALGWGIPFSCCPSPVTLLHFVILLYGAKTLFSVSDCGYSVYLDI